MLPSLTRGVDNSYTGWERWHFLFFFLKRNILICVWNHSIVCVSQRIRRQNGKNYWVTSPAPNTLSSNAKASFESFSIQQIQLMKKYVRLSDQLLFNNSFIDLFVYQKKNPIFRSQIFWSRCWMDMKFRWMEAPQIIYRSEFCICSLNWSACKANKVLYRPKRIFQA